MIDDLKELRELIEQKKSFIGHKGRKGKVGGSLPSDKSTPKKDYPDESGVPVKDKIYYDTPIDKMGLPNGYVYVKSPSSGVIRKVQSYGQSIDLNRLLNAFRDRYGTDVLNSNEFAWVEGMPTKSKASSMPVPNYHLVNIEEFAKLGPEELKHELEVHQRQQDKKTKLREYVAGIAAERSNHSLDRRIPKGADKASSAEPNFNALGQLDDYMKNGPAAQDLNYEVLPAIQISSAKDQPYLNRELAIQLKDRVVKRLAEESGLDYDVVNAIIKSWAQTSNKGSDAAALQCAAQKTFGSKISDWQARSLPASVVVVGAEGKEPVASPTAFQKKVSQCAKVLKVMYKITQEELSDKDAVVLYRGVAVSRDGYENVGSQSVVSVDSNAMESWSIDVEVANEFADSYSWEGPDTKALVFRSVVPRERILSTPLTGFGCWSEREVVVLGGTSGEDMSRVVQA